MEFIYHLPVDLYFGAGKINDLPDLVKNLGSRVLLVTGEGYLVESGFIDKIADQLRANLLETTVFTNVAENPTLDSVREGATLAKQNKSDIVVGIGGGSFMDCAKAIAFAAKNSEDILTYVLGENTGCEALPTILIPTTCGTGSEVNRYTLLNNPETGDKLPFGDDLMIPTISLVDPNLMKTLPKQVLAAAGFDALTHAMESYLSKRGQPITQLLALESIRLLGENLVELYKDYEYELGWQNVTLASTLAGMAMDISGLGPGHGLEHPVSGLRNIVHGRGMAALIPVIFKHSYQSDPQRFAKISQLLGGKDENDCTERIMNLLDALDLNVHLKEEGMKEEDIPILVENVKAQSMDYLTNYPVTFSDEEIVQLYKEAL
ncbi:iron-containing alcohol dehydrogenase [Enterococcus sp. 669A]|uniref:Iron-containing alcohol dehydrogenase n=1 Tax=Candidatus Enterococcus moelleringii TaxID=2815325 RepID=A0ABS3LEM8_9ENTE|nr:iron-containing alcohol dehydrogenase [Enterococcus sp. 669A]MBO1308091.1 iron-containing alcohol dehydrogenase [Enterococcus sp. 669A]